MVRYSPRAPGFQPKQYAQPFDQNLGSPLIYFFYLHTTIRQKNMILFHLIFLLSRPFDQKSGSSLIYFFYLHTTIRPKTRVLINFFLFVHDHSTKVRGHSYSLIYSFFNSGNISFGILKAVLPFYFVRSIRGSAALTLKFRTLYSWKCYSYISYAIFMAI